MSYQYSAGIDDEVSQLSMLKDGSVRLANYEYLGYTQVVSQTYEVPDLYQDDSGSYPGFDRFGRVIQSKWSRSLVGGDIDLNNWRGDVTAMVTSTGYQAEMVRYSAYGTPFGYPGGDCDGDVDSTDSAVLASNYSGTTTGRGVLSAGGNEVGYAGMMWFESGRYLARHRWHDPELGRWGRRDPLGHVDGASLFEFVSSGPVTANDPTGMSWKYGRVALVLFAPPASTGYGLKCEECPGSVASPNVCAETNGCDFSGVRVCCKLTYNGKSPVNDDPNDDHDPYDEWHFVPGITSEPRGIDSLTTPGVNQFSITGGKGQVASTTVKNMCPRCFIFGDPFLGLDPLSVGLTGPADSQSTLTAY